MAERLAALSDERAVGPLRALGEVIGERNYLKNWRSQGLRHGQVRSDRSWRYLARQVAIAAVVVEHGQLAFFVRLFGLAYIVLVAMVAEVGSVRRLMLAIRSRCRPGILEWQSE